MKKNPKVLILFASYGEGHRQVAYVLQKQLHNKGIKDVMVTDLFALAHPWIDNFTRYLYAKSYSLAPSLYGWSYYSTRNMVHDTLLSRWFNSYGMRKMLEIIRQEQPDAVINTFPMLVMLELQKRIEWRIPIFTVLTDFALHNRWLHQAIDHFYVPTEDMKLDMLRKRIHADQITVTGIPLRDGFGLFHIDDPIEQYLAFGLHPAKKIVLVMASTYGRSKLREIGQAFITTFQDHLTLKDHLQIILLCGKDHLLKRQLEHDFLHHSMIRVFGFVENIPQLMKISTCIVTKAGGITLSEALAINIPIVIFRPVPGQEAENARYLTAKGAAITISRVEHLVQEVSRLLVDADWAARLKKAVQLIQKPFATETVIDDILSRLETEPSKLEAEHYLQDGGVSV